jgi:hypothetical protein
MKKVVKEAIREMCRRTKDIRNGDYKNNKEIKKNNQYTK